MKSLQMKKILLFGFVLTTIIGLNAQNTFFPTTAGVVQTYIHKNEKGKEKNYTRQTINDVKVSGDETIVSYTFEILDNNQKSKNLPEAFPCKVVIKGDVVTLDMNEAFAAMRQDAQMNAVVEITGVPMEISGSLKPGQKIKDANMTMTMDLGIMKMQTSIQMTDGECLSIEDVTVPAGTFKCHKITQTTTTTVMKKKIMSKTISWLAIGIGTVKTESYDEKNKLTGTSELVQLKE